MIVAHVRKDYRVITHSGNIKSLKEFTSAIQRPSKSKWESLHQKLRESDEDGVRKEHDEQLPSMPLSSHHCESDEEMSSGEEASSVSSAEEDGEEGETTDLWVNFVEIANNSDDTILECLRPYLRVYYDLEDDDAYQKIMKDVMRLLSPIMSFTSALRDAIDQNRDLIVSSVEHCRNNCQDFCGDILTIWCVMGSRYVKDECRWFS